MTRDQAIALIIHSRRIFHGWREAPPTGPRDDTLRMIAQEIAILEGIATQFPEKAETVEMLLRDWNAMAEGLRAKAN